MSKLNNDNEQCEKCHASYNKEDWSFKCPNCGFECGEDN